MTKTQRENLAKFFYDIGKLIFAAFILANIMSGKVSIELAATGIIGVLTFVLIGHYLNKKE